MGGNDVVLITKYKTAMSKQVMFEVAYYVGEASVKYLGEFWSLERALEYAEDKEAEYGIRYINEWRYKNGWR